MTTVDQIKKLREETSAGVMDTKRALEDAGGDFKQAKQLLQEAGAVKAQKKSDREASDGLIASYVHANGKIGTLIELFCETDFVARTDDFQKLAKELAMQIAAADPKDSSELLAQEYIRDPSRTVQDIVNDAISKVGENVKVGRIVRFQI